MSLLVIRATKEGSKGLPVSVKTRIGFNEESLDSWIPHLLEEEPAAITIHGRTKKEMSRVPASWEVLFLSLFDECVSSILILITSYVPGYKKGV